METILEEDCFDMAPSSSSTPSESPNEEAQEIPIGVALGFALSADKRIAETTDRADTSGYPSQVANDGSANNQDTPPTNSSTPGAYPLDQPESDLAIAQAGAQDMLPTSAPPPRTHSRRPSEHDLMVCPTGLTALDDTEYNVMLDVLVNAAAQCELTREICDRIIKGFLSDNMSFGTALRDVCWSLDGVCCAWALLLMIWVLMGTTA
ncbi:hypothetical protein CB0940_11168 [Cercospora beticola]|uniref:Uncharacterized protein n=1 Tax=Cercospora beticola TaxID=122368 RepID=A0A2G5HDR6_CERBT|nr:hypothetical protein CB0940_11168 [Cercospora beticola]PIA90696.1 hypothetical protein CB0940_11168 [Cercospora beticola]WPB07998.1 hypothetical protein RHO25_012662 [Cercospora beticola]CAK1368146.1 unnamed protein product [Cercospora beticola]